MKDTDNIVDRYIQFAHELDEIQDKSIITRDILNNIKNQWHELYLEQLKMWGFNKKGSKLLFDWGCYGHNWDKLHQSKEEKKLSCMAWMVRFALELEYCCDRMSLDRLFRNHWLYNQMMIASKKLIRKREI